MAVPSTIQPEQTHTMASKSKFFRVATEGATTDGRIIERNWIQQMAASFDPQVYGARIWMEHIRGTLPDSPFKAYGDVVAVKAEEVEIDGGKKMALFAQIEPTPELVAMTKARQKIYTSIEINPKFADTGEAYLVGLGVTDSPASLGTEMLSFASKSPGGNPLASRKVNPDNLFSAAVEVHLEFEDASDPESKSLSATVKNMLKRFSAKKTGDDARFADISEAVEALMTHVGERDDKFRKAEDKIAALETELKSTKEALHSFKTQMDTQENTQGRRPAATGGSGEQQTEF